MTEESDRDLVKRAETALAGMALPEPDWDGLVQRIEGSVVTAPPENEALFEAPFPATDADGIADAAQALGNPAEPVVADSVPSGDAPVSVAEADTGPTISVAAESADELEDGWANKPEATSASPEEPVEVEATSEPSAARAPEAPREAVSLADLARATMARRGSAEAANIAKESLAMASQSRVRDQISQRAQAASSVAPPARSVPPPARSVPPPAPSARRSTAPPPNAQGGDVLRGPWIGVAIAGIGLAAAFALVLSGRNNLAPAVVIETAQHKVAEPTPPAPPSPAKIETPPAAEAEPLPAPRAALDATALPSLPPGSAPRADAKPAPAGAKAAASPTPAPGAGKVVAEKIVLEEEGKAAPKAAPSAPRPADSKLRPAELSSNNMTERPSAGAAQAAVGSVLGAARSCVAGHPQPSSAQLIFTSDGQVQSVAVAGPAAGTPAAGCIESALKKARVQPFAAPSFSLGVTIRPPERRAD
jgi:hypothetical protein